MLYPEFSQYKSFVDPSNHLCNAYKDSLGNTFFVEPSFYLGLQAYKDRQAKDYPAILERMDMEIKRNHKVIFVGDYESPFVIKDDFIYLELPDITDPLKVTWVDDSRPSDYGD